MESRSEQGFTTLPSAAGEEPTTLNNRKLTVGLLIGCVGAVAAIALVVTLATSADSKAVEVDRQWTEYKQLYSHSFDDELTEATRKAIFAQHLDTIEKHNQEHAEGKQTYTMGINKFAHLTVDEFVAKRVNGLRSTIADTHLDHFEAEQTKGLATSVDWVAQGMVGPVRDQGECGSCYAFSSTAAIESAVAIKTRRPVPQLAPQNLVDCSYAEGDHGCDGGSLVGAFTFASKYGVCTEQSYPYQETDKGQCHTCNVGAKITSFAQVKPDMHSLQAAVAQQPVSVCINADPKQIMFYSGGIFSSACPDNLDHGVVVVGYGELDGTAYWKIRNSWGPDWGLGGYMLMEKGKAQTGGQCGILEVAFVPIV